MPDKEVIYGGYRILSNRVPQDQFNYGLGFGWGFRLFMIKENEPKYALVIKSLLGPCTDENIDRAYMNGLRKVKELIDISGFEDTYLCFRWEPTLQDYLEITQVECDEVSPGNMRSPFP